MKAEHGFFHRVHACVWALLFALPCFPLSAEAAWINRATGQGIWDAATKGRTTTLGVGEGRMVVIKPATGGGSGWMNANGTGPAPGNWSVKAAPTGGGVRVGADSTVMVAERAVPVTVVGDIAKEAIASGVIGCATGGIPGCVLGVGVPLAFAYFNLSGSVRVNPAGQLERKDPTACTVGPCYEWRVDVSDYQWFRSPQAACEYSMGILNSGRWGTGFALTSVTLLNGVTCRYNGNRNGSAFSGTDQLVSRSAPVQSATWYPSTTEEARDALISAGAPINPGIVPELEKTGVNWTDISRSYFGTGSGPVPSLTEPQVTGPSSVTSPKETTTNPNGSTSTKQGSTPMTYSGNKVTAGDTVTTTTVTNSDGSSGGTTTTTTSAGTEGDKPQEDPPTQCDKYPNTLGCAELDVPEGTIPKSSKNLTFTPEDRFGTGSCPADKSWSIQTTGTTVVAVDWGMVCGWALPLRALIMSLAALVALLIVMPGGKTEL